MIYLLRFSPNEIAILFKLNHFRLSALKPCEPQTWTSSVCKTFDDCVWPLNKINFNSQGLKIPEIVVCEFPSLGTSHPHDSPPSAISWLRTSGSAKYDTGSLLESSRRNELSKVVAPPQPISALLVLARTSGTVETRKTAATASAPVAYSVLAMVNAMTPDVVRNYL